MGKSLKEMYVIVGVPPFDSSTSLEDHFRLVKKSYRAKALKHHPDKGGDPEDFRILQTAFEYLRDHVYVENAAPLENITKKRDDFESTYKEVSKRDVPSWEFYRDAPEEIVPLYNFQYAASKRSTCKVCGTKIDKGELRIGKLNDEYGTYGKFSKVDCFSWEKLVPFVEKLELQPKTMKKVLDALEQLEGIYIRGFSQLSLSDKKMIATCIESIEVVEVVFGCI